MIEDFVDERDGDLLMDAAEHLEDELARVLDEVVDQMRHEEVGGHDRVALAQLLLRAVEVVLDVEAHEQLGDRVGVVVLLDLDDLHHLLQVVLALAARHDGHGQVAQDVRRDHLQRVQVAVRLEAQLDEVVARRRRHVLGVRQDRHPQRPVDEPRALLQQLQVGAKLLQSKNKSVVESLTWLSMNDLSLVKSSRASSQCCSRISQASLPHMASR